MRMPNSISRNSTCLTLVFLVLAVGAIPAAAQGPVFDVWYGAVQSFGSLGEPQDQYDIQGNVSDPDGVTLLSYTLNGGPSVPMGIGPDTKRLQKTGDFLVDLWVADLLPGANTVVITAEDALANSNSTVVTVNFTTGNTWPLPYSTDWGSLVTDGDPLTPDPAILDQAQVVNGKWTVVGDEIQIVESGFDRLVAIGNVTWDDYEVTTSFTIDNPLSDAGTGIKVRWNGHTNTPIDCGQPRCGYEPLGELGWVFQDELQFLYGGGTVPFPLTEGTLYWMKMRVRTDAGSVTYSLKAWEDGAPEPGFMISRTDVANDPSAGSLMLTSHQNQTTFGNVTVTPVIEVAPVAVDDAAFVLTGTSKDLNVTANDFDDDGDLVPGSVAITSGPYHGTITGIDPTTGVVTYLHDGGVALADSFTYTVEDSQPVTSNEATVRLTIGDTPPIVFRSDDFNSCELSDFWTFVDPKGDGTPPAIQGAFTGDSKMALTVPTGSSHEMYTFGLQAPYIYQAATDDDFILDVKWDSVLPTTNFAEQGIIILQDTSNWLRLEFYSNGSDEVNILAGYPDAPFTFEHIVTIPGISAGTTPLYMRIQREGSLWTQSYSTDGSAWTALPSFTHPLFVNGVGLYAGNAGDNPEHTILVDYFSIDDDPVDGTDDTGLNVPAVTVEGNGAVTRNPDLASYACGDPVQLTAAPDPGWAFTGWSGDTLTTNTVIDIVMDRPWELTATFEATVENVVSVNTSGIAGLSTALTCADAIPVEITRNTADPVKGISLTLDLTGLAPCAGVASFTEGTYLNSVGLTDFIVTDNLDGTWTVDIAIQGGQPCGATAASGVLFTVDLANTIANGTGVAGLSGLGMWDCGDQALTVDAGADGTILVDTTPPVPVEGLAVGPLLTTVPPGIVIKNRTTWSGSPSPDAADVTVYRKAFGIYPEYDDIGGAPPALPTDPAAEGWEYINTRTVAYGQVDDYIPARNYWYFCAVTRDSLGNEATPVMAGAALNYLLGDVTDGGNPPAQGDNVVDVADLTRLGSGYGTAHGDQDYQAVLDIGPTDDLSVTGLPTTDNLVNFEDLILFSLNFLAEATGKKANITPANITTTLPPSAPANVVMAAGGEPGAKGETYSVHLELAGDGTLQGLQIPLEWDPDVVEPVSVHGGPLLTAQGGAALVLSPEPGTIDIALMGARDTGISGSGEIATAVFRIVGPGDPAVTVVDPHGRNVDNEPVDVAVGLVSDSPGKIIPTVSALRGNYPNPFNPSTTIAFDLAREADMRLSIYGIDGRLVRELVRGHYPAGRHEEVWDGRDTHGRGVASGTYFYVMQTEDLRQTRRMLLVK